MHRCQANVMLLYGVGHPRRSQHTCTLTQRTTHQARRSRQLMCQHLQGSECPESGFCDVPACGEWSVGGADRGRPCGYFGSATAGGYGVPTAAAAAAPVPAPAGAQSSDPQSDRGVSARPSSAAETGGLVVARPPGAAPPAPAGSGGNGTSNAPTPAAGEGGVVAADAQAISVMHWGLPAVLLALCVLCDKA